MFCIVILSNRWSQIRRPPIPLGSVKIEKVDENELEALAKFYRQHNAEAWIPMQLKVGPYYCVKQDGKIVSAAGVHVVTPQIAQLGNIVTDEAYRNRGYATACTSVLATDLASKGRIISLFVRTDNYSAMRVYEKLGFRKVREVVFLVLKKKNL
ncbi:MAG: GNAT family N-acetyltransferase [Candidatus Bathyarchaeia archaeon]|nr:GNAT family N-acetyltransferase [Candidatus Bathyarchaeota archaeon A05DMB-4]MDH7595193.1 GNAT family N-acetyltransferase [Candidatus Bathyarchaeota archaeon]